MGRWTQYDEVLIRHSFLAGTAYNVSHSLDRILTVYLKALLVPLTMPILRCTRSVMVKAHSTKELPGQNMGF